MLPERMYNAAHHWSNGLVAKDWSKARLNTKFSKSALIISHLPHPNHHHLDHLKQLILIHTMKTYTSILLLLASAKVAYGHSSESEKQDVSSNISFESLELIGGAKSANMSKGMELLNDPIRRFLVDGGTGR